MDDYIIQTKNVKFLDIEYPDINIKENEFLFIKGKSGCGKSSFFKILNRTQKAKNGKIYFLGKDISSYNVLSYRSNVLLVSQTPFLFEGTIKENFEQYYDAINEKLISEDKMKQMMNICCFEKLSEHKCFNNQSNSFDILNTDTANLSEGEKQRVFLAIFLSLAKKVLLLDEVSSALDYATASVLFSNLKKYAKENNLTVIAICHDKNIISTYSDRCINFY